MYRRRCERRISGVVKDILGGFITAIALLIIFWCLLPGRYQIIVQENDEFELIPIAVYDWETHEYLSPSAEHLALASNTDETILDRGCYIINNSVFC